jgi:hypothetical protein
MDTENFEVPTPRRDFFLVQAGTISGYREVYCRRILANDRISYLLQGDMGRGPSAKFVESTLYAASGRLIPSAQTHPLASR